MGKFKLVKKIQKLITEQIYIEYFHILCHFAIINENESQ